MNLIFRNFGSHFSNSDNRCSAVVPMSTAAALFLLQLTRQPPRKARIPSIAVCAFSNDALKRRSGGTKPPPCTCKRPAPSCRSARSFCAFHCRAAGSDSFCVRRALKRAPGSGSGPAACNRAHSAAVRRQKNRTARFLPSPAKTRHLQARRAPSKSEHSLGISRSTRLGR